MEILTTEHSANGSTERLLLALLFLFSVGALFAPSIGPVLDHHFPERQHSHTHIYFGPSASDHGHQYQETHPHSHILSKQRVTHKSHIDAQLKQVGGGAVNFAPRSDSTHDKIVYLTSTDGIGQQVAARIMPVVQASAIFADSDLFFFTFAHYEQFLNEAFAAPPEKPPRA